MARVLLMLPTATYRAPDFLAAARRLGAEVVVGCDEPQALGEAMSDRALLVPMDDVDAGAEAVVSFARARPLDAVVAVDDQGVLVAATAAERLGLPHNPPDAVARTRNKVAMRSALDGRVPQPEWRTAGVDDDPGAIAASIGFPVVVKPVPLSGSRGVIRADDADACRSAAGRVRAILADAGFDPRRELIVERYLPGAEVAVEGLLRGGRLEVLAIFDKPDPLEGPYFEETIYVTPSRLRPETQTLIASTAGWAAEALGLVEGPVHAELRVHGDDVWVLELAARSIGGLCARSLRFGLGVSLEEIILRHALRRKTGPLRRESGASGVMMLPIPRSGVLVGVSGLERASAVEHIAGVEVTIPAGSRVVALPEGDRYLGFLFARANDPGEVEAALRAAHAELGVVIT